jgi:hypothetical protein
MSDRMVLSGLQKATFFCRLPAFPEKPAFRTFFSGSRSTSAFASQGRGRATAETPRFLDLRRKKIPDRRVQ